MFRFLLVLSNVLGQQSMARFLSYRTIGLCHLLSKNDCNILCFAILTGKEKVAHIYFSQRSNLAYGFFVTIEK